MTDAVASKRARGRPRRIDRDSIVAAARGLPPEALTMQAVADRLGVDRKALNYHVSDRDGLLELVAADAFNDEVASIVVDLNGTWQDAAWAFAGGMRASITSIGTLAPFLRLEGEASLSALGPAEALLEVMLGAGFDTATAGFALAHLAELAAAAVQNAQVAGQGASGEHPQTSELRRALGSSSDARYPAIREIVSADPGLMLGDAQFDFDMRLAILGLQQLLAR